MYSLYVYDKLLDLIGIVEDINSLQWLSEYQDAGEVKLVVAATEKNRSLLQNGYRLYNTEQSESAVIAETQINDDGKSNKLTVRALMSVERWSHRVVLATERITNIEVGMLQLTTKHRRGLLGATGTAKGYAKSTDTQITWGSVLDAEMQLAIASGFGFREFFSPASTTEVFEVYKGIDRTIENSESYNGYFGDDIDNLANLQITSSDVDYKNVAIVGGVGEGSARIIVTVELGICENYNRREIWVDAKDISRTYQIATKTGVDEYGNPIYKYTEASYSDGEYTALLRARGMEKLLEQIKTLKISATLGQELMLYGKDYFLGDIVPLKLTKYALRISARIQSVRTIYESSGKTITAVLSDFNIMKETLKK